MKTSLNQLEDVCLNLALLAAVENGSPINPMKLILRGATNIDEALAKSRNLKQYAVTAALLIIKAAMVNDRILVMKLYGENVQGQETKIPLTRADNLAELQAAMSSNTIKTAIPIEISRRNNASAVREELLIRTGVDKNNGIILWFGLRLMELEISWLRKIFWVKTLKLARNEFTSLPTEMGHYLKQCVKLDLQWNKLCEIPPSVLELPSLSELNLSHNDLVNIPDVPEWSPSLLVLDLSYNCLSSLPNSAVAPALRNLNISNNQFRIVPHCVCSFVSLTTLSIANNFEIITLPTELGNLKNLRDLNIYGVNSLIDLPKSVRTAPGDSIRYLKNLLHGTSIFYHMKIMLVGKQATGKTTLVAQLRGDNKQVDSTVGVDISQWAYRPWFMKPTFHFSIWDFAGQEEYDVAHYHFLSQDSLYLLVWNVTEGDAGIAGLKPWLNNIYARAPGSHVIIVGTFLDMVSRVDRLSGKIDNLLQKVMKLTEKYCHLIVVNVTVVGLEGHMYISPLKDTIYKAAEEYKENNQYIMGQRIPSSYLALNSKLLTIHHLTKQGKHKPVMHTAEFKEIVRELQLIDIQDDDELHTVACFLHEIGSLLHFDDYKSSLSDLYFVDPHWLCDLMSTIVTNREANSYAKQGIIESKNIPFLFKDKGFPHKYFNQYLTLLNRFELALPLDKNYRRVLIPSMFPKKCPNVADKLRPDNESCYKRFVLFNKDQMSYCSAPPRLWDRLLLRVMNTVKEVKNVLDEQISIDNLIISDRTQNVKATEKVHNSVPEDSLDQTEPISVYSNNEPLESALLSVNTELEPLPCISKPQNFSDSESIEVFSVEEDYSLVYWSTGLLYNVNGLAFNIESLTENSKYHDKDGILIMTSQGVEGCNMLCQLIDIVEKLISEWYPGLSDELEHIAPCPKCRKSGIASPHEFRVNELLPLITNHKLTHVCNANHKIQLVEIVPDLLLADLKSAFFLNFEKLLYRKESKSLLAIGTFGEVYKGKYENQTVAIKFYKAEKSSNVVRSFRELRFESKVMQQLYHPCLVCMVGVIVNPVMSLVLEEAPKESLYSLLLREQEAFSRIILYRIAIQVASALCFLHSINNVFQDLKADNVLLWSLSPDHLINCKVTDFNINSHSKPVELRNLHGTKGFVAPEIYHAKECSVYDHQADIFSFGMFLYQMVARRQPFHNIEPFKIEAAIEEGKRPKLEDVPVAEIGLYYMSRIMKLCWAGDPMKRPTSQQIIEWFSASALQLIISVIPVNCKYSIRNGCIVTPDINNEVDLPTISSELWICCDGVGGGQVRILTTNTLVEVRRHSVRENQMQSIKQCGQYVWVPSRIDLEYGVVNIFNKTTKDLVHSLKMKENSVSCITSSDDLVYLGTMEGNCFVFPVDVADIQTNARPHFKCISEHCIDGLAVSQTLLWASIRDQIHFLNAQTLEFEGVEKRKQNVGSYVGKMMLSDDRNVMWSAHLGGIILSAWNTHECTHKADVDVSTCAEQQCHINDLQDRIMTAMCIALDTVWIGLSSGFIMVFSMSPPGKLLTYFRPYNSFIRFLSSCNYPGPCQEEKCMMLCGGKMYCPDDSFKELPDYPRKNEKGESVDASGVVVLWEVLPAKYTRQVHYLSKSTIWQDYSTLKKAMKDTDFKGSMQYCQ